MAQSTFDIAVIGSGIVGLTAAGVAARAGRSVVAISDSELWGGLVANVGDLQGFPAGDGMSGLDVALALYAENVEAGVEAVTQAVTGIERVEGGGFRVRGSEDSWRAGAVIAASGARLKMLDVPGARVLVDKGVSQCAWCDGGLYKGADVVVVGSGDAALEEALHLAEVAGSVTVLARGEQLKARPDYVIAASANARIAIRCSTSVEAVLGASGVEGVRVRDTHSGHVEDIACRGVFVFIGLQPASDWLGALVQRDAGGAVVTGAGFETATPGLFAAGAVRSGYGGRLAQAIDEATSAAGAASAFTG